MKPEEIDAICERFKLTRQRLGYLMGYSEAHVNRIAAGKAKPSKDALTRLAVFGFWPVPD